MDVVDDDYAHRTSVALDKAQIQAKERAAKLMEKAAAAKEAGKRMEAEKRSEMERQLLEAAGGDDDEE